MSFFLFRLVKNNQQGENIVPNFLIEIQFRLPNKLSKVVSQVWSSTTKQLRSVVATYAPLEII